MTIKLCALERKIIATVKNCVKWIFNGKKSPKRRFIIGIIFEITLLIFVINQYLGHGISIKMGFHIPLILMAGVLLSNIASCWIIGFVKDEFLWKKVCEKYTYPNDKSRSLKDWWSDTNHYSPISYILGIIERIIVVLAGIMGFKAFFAASGAWLTLKIAADWTMFQKIEYRAISHIYLITSASSLLLAAIDVAAVRMVLNLKLLSC